MAQTLEDLTGSGRAVMALVVQSPHCNEDGVPSGCRRSYCCLATSRRH